MQTEKSQPKGERIMSETRFTEFPALSVDPRVGISRSASETDHRYPILSTRYSVMCKVYTGYDGRSEIENK